MSKQPDEQIVKIAGSFPYPDTPEIAIPVQVPRSSMRLQLARTVIVMILLFGGLMLIPPIRAAILEFFRIGAVEITITDVPATPEALPTALADLTERTTLEEAQESVNFDIKLPAAYPDPDHVFVHGRNDRVVIITWMAGAAQDEIQMMLFQIAPSEGIFYKELPDLIETEVNGQPAIWLDVPHYITQDDNVGKWMHYVPGNVLIWTEGEITYRPETGMELEEARLIAESLQ